MERYFGGRIKMFRERKGLTQAELAKKLGYSSESMISKIESGATPVPARKVSKFAEALGVSVETLLGKEDVPLNIDNAVEIVNQMEAMQEILALLSTMDAKKLKRIAKLIKALEEE